MARNILELITGSLDDKKQWRRDKARIDALPEPYAKAANAVLRYLMYYGGLTEGRTIVGMVTDLADLWERAAADATPVREIVGDDPVEFAESFADAYGGKHWIDKERQRLMSAIDEAAAEGRTTS